MKEKFIPRPSAKYRKVASERSNIKLEQRRAAAKTARAAQRTPSRGVKREAERNEIAEYLARVPPTHY